MDGVGRASLPAKGLQSSAGQRGLYAVKNHVLHRKPTCGPEMVHVSNGTSLGGSGSPYETRPLQAKRRTLHLFAEN